MPAPDKETIKHLNNVLMCKLAVIHQYFLHARMMKHMGYMRLADYEYKESIQQMKFADKLVEKVLSLNGVPNMQEPTKVNIGASVEEILKYDLEAGKTSIIYIKDAINTCKNSDMSNIEMLENILGNEEEHISFITSQLNLIDTLGLPKYLQSHA